ncbi:MAG: NAD(P)-dependent alcohol dehydrogenase [Ignavibacteria bacterium]
MNVNAMAAFKKGAPLNQFRYGIDELGQYDCIIKVISCGLCHSDIHAIDNFFPVKYPMVPGHEVIGEVVEIGTGVNHLKISDIVGVGWQRSACLQCEDCINGNENVCTSAKGVITDGYGGFADYLVMDSRFCFLLPSGLDRVKAGPLMCGGITVYSALKYAGMKSGQRIGVIGAGGLGHLAIQFAAKLGNKVTVFTTSKDKAEFAINMGASEVVITKDGSKIETERPLDIIISTVPADLDWGKYVRLLSTDGTLTFVGLFDKPISIDLFSLLSRRRKITASPIGGRAAINEMLKIASDFKIEPIIETFSLKDVNVAIKKVRENTIRYRAVIIP